MSAFADKPAHYVQWLKSTYQPNANETELAAAFSTRQQYGVYLSQLWQDAVSKLDNDKTIRIINDYADDIVKGANLLHITLRNTAALAAHTVILATGNANPAIPKGIDKTFLKSKYYFANPWGSPCMENISGPGDILIIGAGLTAIDAVIGLKHRGFEQTIHTISPNGYLIKPWQEDKLPYTGMDMTGIMNEAPPLLQLLRLVNTHRKIALKLGQSAYAIVDSFRPYTQQIWQGFSLNEKRQFIKYLKIFWEKARHRLPNQQHNLVAALLKNGRLVTHKGYIASITETNGEVTVKLNSGATTSLIKVQRVINCISPETDIEKQENPLLNNLARKGMITAGPCRMGINACTDDHSVITADDELRSTIFVTGSNLKGMLRESTAAPELRVQAKKIAECIREKFAVLNDEVIIA